jgi:hypothetical protein
MNFPLSVGFGLLALVTASAEAQIVHHEQVVGQGNGSQARCFEPAVAVSRAYPADVAVIWQRTNGGPGTNPTYTVPSYRFSADGGVTFLGSATDMDFAGSCASKAFDPVVVASPTSQLMCIAGIGDVQGNWGPILVADRVSASAFGSVTQLTPCPEPLLLDKHWMAIGPVDSSPSDLERTYAP